MTPKTFLLPLVLLSGTITTSAQTDKIDDYLKAEMAIAGIFTELGAAIILGGNIRGQTRTLTTVLALEYSKPTMREPSRWGSSLLRRSGFHLRDTAEIR